jgi:hypothetical protein
MSGPVDPIRRVARVQRVDAVRRHDACDDEGMFKPVSQLPMVVPQPEATENEARASAAPLKSDAPASAPFAAQLLGQPGVKRGLKGGQEVLDNARATYLSAEFSGPNDRRPPKGRLTKTEI